MEFVLCSSRQNALHVVLSRWQFLLRCLSVVARTIPHLSLSRSPPPLNPFQQKISALLPKRALRILMALICLTFASPAWLNGAHTEKSFIEIALVRPSVCDIHVCSACVAMDCEESVLWARWQGGEGGTRHLRKAGHGNGTYGRNTCTNFKLGNMKVKRLFEKHRRIWEDDIKTNLKGTI
jgi:hypothetical protein